MEVKAKEIIAQELKKIKRKPLLEEVSEDEIEKIIKEDLNSSDGVTKLEATFDAHGNPDRLRIMDGEGNMYDVMILASGKVGIEKLEPRIHYLGIKPFKSWMEAQAALPDWVSERAVNASTLERNPYCLGGKLLGAGLEETSN